MKLARVRTADGVVVGEYDDGHVGGYVVGEDAELIAPCDPSTLYCAGRTYRDYLDHTGNEQPEDPHFFLKPPASVWPPDSTIPYPTFADGVGYAGELAAVIDERCRDLDAGEVADSIRGYTIMNDVDAIGEPGSAKKVFRGAAPLGPWIETNIDPHGLSLRTTVGDEIRQDGSTADMLFDPHDIISFLSQRVTFRPGDVVAFGSPANPGRVAPGAEIECWYEGIGTLRNTLGRPAAG